MSEKTFSPPSWVRVVWEILPGDYSAEPPLEVPFGVELRSPSELEKKLLARESALFAAQARITTLETIARQREECLSEKRAELGRFRVRNIELEERHKQDRLAVAARDRELHELRSRMSTLDPEPKTLPGCGGIAHVFAPGTHVGGPCLCGAKRL